MRTVAVATQKGGEGKTTLAVHLAHAAADKGMKVLFVDLDTQGNSTLTFTGDSRFAHAADYGFLTASHLFSENADLEALPEPYPVLPNLRLIGPDPKLPLHVNGYVDYDDPALLLPRTWLNLISGDYDLCVIDAPPAFGFVLSSLLTASDSVITPITMDVFSLDGTAELLSTLERVRNHTNPDLQHIGIVPNKINTRSQEEMRTLESLREHYGALITPFAFTDRRAVKMAVANQRPVWKSPNGASHRKASAEWKANCGVILDQVFR